MNRPRLAIAGLTACFGCQLTLLNCEGELGELVDRFDFAWFPMANSGQVLVGEFDASMVEGAVSTQEDLQLLMELRSRSKLLIAFGTCAVWGGIAAMNKGIDRQGMFTTVYGGDQPLADFPHPEPLRGFVSVDHNIVGCPPEKNELLASLAGLLYGALPLLPDYPVCVDCRIRENLCLLMEGDRLCLGPITRAGCGARCPAVAVPCEGCRGPVAEANVAAEIELLLEKGVDRQELISRMRRFCPEWDHGQRC